MTFNRNFQKKSNIQKTLKGTGAEYTIATENVISNIVKIDLWVNTLKDYDIEKISSFAQILQLRLC